MSDVHTELAQGEDGSVWQVAHLYFTRETKNAEVNTALAMYPGWEPFSTMPAEDDAGNPIWVLSLRRRVTADG